jgi:DNA-binding MarR family transcriptional regulator
MADVAGFLLNEVARVIRERTAAAIEHHRVHPRQLGLLFLLRDAGASSQQQLGERLGMDRTTTMQLVAALEAAGLVARDDDPDDRRAYRLRLTARGRDVTAALFETVTEVERQTLKALKAAERQQLKVLLRKVLESPEGR